MVTNSVAIAALLVTQIIFLALYGPSHRYSSVYVSLVVLLLAIAIGSTLLIKKSVSLAMQVYVWSSLLCVIAMVTIDALILPDSFPIILFTLHLGIWSLGMTTGLKALIPFTAVSVVILLIAGLVYNSVDSAIVAIFLAIVAGSPALEVRRLSKELETLCEAVRVWTNGRNDNSNPGTS